jgi:hypothetical protein
MACLGFAERSDLAQCRLQKRLFAVSANIRL